MIVKSSILTYKQLLVTKSLLSLIVQTKNDKAWKRQHPDVQLIATSLEQPLENFNGWKISIISSTHHTQNIIFVCLPTSNNEQDNCFVLKVQVFLEGEDSPLSSEASFYQLHQYDCLPDFLGFFMEKDVSAIALEYLDKYLKFSSLLWGGDLADADSKGLFQAILDFISNDLYYRGDTKSLSSGDNWKVFRKLFLDRATTRLGEIKSDNSSFQRVIFLNECIINGVIIPGPIKLLNALAKEGSFIADLLPQSLGSIHGDLHLGNILVDKKNLIRWHDKYSVPKFILVDPRFYNPGPIIYDLAKIYQSFYGHYEAIMRGAYQLEPISDNSFSLHFMEPSFYKSLEFVLENNIKGVCTNLECNPVNFHWACILSTGIHLIAAAPHHIYYEKEAMAMLLWGCYLACEAFAKVKNLV